MALAKAAPAPCDPLHGLVRWVVDPKGNLPSDTRLAFAGSLYGTLPIFVCSVLNTVFVSSFIAVRMATVPFLIWAIFEIVIGLVRVPVLVAGQRSIRHGSAGPTNFYVLLALCWAMSVGYGMFISTTSGDWVVACLACLSGAAMVAGICVRNFAAPRLVAAMTVLSLGPCVAGAVASGEKVLLAVAIQVPLFVVAMTFAAFELNKMMVRTLLAERENDRRADHDPLTGLLNRAGLARDVARRIAGGESFSLFYLDLDSFRAVNDTFDHQIGDALLKAVAERLAETCQEGDSLARIGGDEFVVITGGRDLGSAEEFGQILIDAIAGECFIIGHEAACVSVSGGIAIYPDHGADLGALLGEADTALYQAKFWGRARCVIARSIPAGNAYPPHQQSLPSGPNLMCERNAA